MPPSSLPTGTVGPTSAGTQTFPSERERAPGAGGAAGSPPSPAVVPRREHDVALDRAQDRIEELERQNEMLRDRIHERDRERQAVVDRYERLLERQQRDRAPAQTTQATDDATTTGDGLLLRLARRLGLR